MTLIQLIRKLELVNRSSDNAGSRDVIVMVGDSPPPFPDVILVEQSEDTVVLRAQVVTKPELPVAVTVSASAIPVELLKLYSSDKPLMGQHTPNP